MHVLCLSNRQSLIHPHLSQETSWRPTIQVCPWVTWWYPCIARGASLRTTPSRSSRRTMECPIGTTERQVRELFCFAFLWGIEILCCIFCGLMLWFVSHFLIWQLIELSLLRSNLLGTPTLQRRGGISARWRFFVGYDTWRGANYACQRNRRWVLFIFVVWDVVKSGYVWFLKWL